ncbi:MAG TPA: hypothetical protein VMX38_02305 [Verrucomicrobiae bacterium]|jgi:hypothetical protein|nr:hypothetical protein [Verrucomicrobiae bacterium]
MGSGDLSNDLLVGILTPAPAARPADSHAGCEDGSSSSRRRHRAKDPTAEGDITAEDDAQPVHEIDRMA